MYRRNILRLLLLTTYMHLEDYWLGLLLLTERVQQSTEAIDFCFISFATSRPEVYINRRPVPSSDSVLVLAIINPEAVIDHQRATVFYWEGSVMVLDYVYDTDEEVIDFLGTYMPYCFLPIRARQQQRAIAITHFAQSLDGKIATATGESKWIGNEENLVHAHRMRALCDSILIGAHTLIADRPSLTVRRVAGKNPRKVVLCSSDVDFSSLRDDDTSPVLVLGTSEDPCVDHTDYAQLPAGEHGRIAGAAILQYLYRRGLYSVYVEGGSATTSHLLRERAIDVVQLHVAPLIFGSGLDSFTLPPIQTVDEAVRFSRFYHKPIGDTFMFVGEIDHD